MVSARRWIIALLAVGLIMTGAAAAWVYFGSGLLPKKGPLKARQVMTSQAPGDMEACGLYMMAENQPGINAGYLVTLWTEPYLTNKEAEEWVS